MAGVALGGVNGGSSCATLNSVGPGIGCQTMFSPVCFQSGFWILVSILLLEGGVNGGSSFWRGKWRE